MIINFLVKLKNYFFSFINFKKKNKSELIKTSQLCNLPIEIKENIFNFLKITDKKRLYHLSRKFPFTPKSFLREKIEKGLNYWIYKEHYNLLATVIVYEHGRKRRFERLNRCLDKIIEYNSQNKNQVY